MNPNEFRRHLESIHNVLNSNQRHLYEETEEVVEFIAEEAEESVEEVEEVEAEEVEESFFGEEPVVEFLESYFGGNLSEDTTDNDIREAIIELNYTCDAINEYFQIDENFWNEMVIEEEKDSKFWSRAGKAAAGAGAAYLAWKHRDKLKKAVGAVTKGVKTAVDDVRKK
mgnify:CR=1 FL=1